VSETFKRYNRDATDVQKWGEFAELIGASQEVVLEGLFCLAEVT
jgi:hypothetical protein